MALSFIKDLWNKCSIRGFMILSLSVHIFLHLFAPLKRKAQSSLLIVLLFWAYLMGDWIAALTVKLISSNGGHPFAHVTKVDNALQVFWTSFLWLHLGTPGTITILTLNNGSRWGQNLLSLVSQAIATVYIFVKTFPSDKSLLIPTLLVLFAGIIKITERVLALNLSSLQRLKKPILLQHKDSYSKEDNSVFEALIIELSNDAEIEFHESIVVKHAYYFFQIFKVFLLDLMFSSKHRTDSRNYFSKVSAVNALRVISVELQFFWELLHTKVSVTRSKWSYFFRFIAFTNVATAFILFSRLKKHRFPVLDVAITYCLLIGGIAIDVIALFELIFSDWTVVEITRYNIRSGSFLDKLVSTTAGLRRPRFITTKVDPNANVACKVLNTPLVFRRWSESIFACNLLSESLKVIPRKKYNHERHWNTFDPRVSRKPFIKELWIFIFGEVKRKSEIAKDRTNVRKIFNARGDFFLKSAPRDFDCRNLLKYVTNTYYNDSIIEWHIATEIWYRKEKVTPNDKREFSKILSDYMLYLLLKQSNLVSAVAVAGIAQMKSVEIFSELWRLRTDGELPKYNKKSTDVEALCDILFEEAPCDILFEDPIEQPHEGNSCRSSCCRWRSPLKGGLRLARKMESLKEKKWDVMSGVWVEMLSYAASHIKGEAHVQVLSRGGELLAFVWLLMAHFGCLHKTGWGMYYEPWADPGSDGNDAKNGGEDDSESDGDDAMNGGEDDEIIVGEDDKIIGGDDAMNGGEDDEIIVVEDDEIIDVEDDERH